MKAKHRMVYADALTQAHNRAVRERTAVHVWNEGDKFWVRTDKEGTPSPGAVRIDTAGPNGEFET